MEYPKVTIVVPCHNHEKWIEGCLDSVAVQDYPNKQIVVVENGSSDGSKSMIHALAKTQPTKTGFDIGKYKNTNIDIAILCERDPKGPSWARNQAIRFAHEFTDLYMFLDSDDLYMQGKVSKSVAIWKQYPTQIGVVYSDYETVGEDGVVIREFKEPFSRLRLTQDCIINCDSLISKLAFDKHGIFDEQLRVCEDYDMWLRISDSFICCHIPEPLVLIRTGSHSSTANVQDKVWQQCRYRVFEKLNQRSGAA